MQNNQCNLPDGYWSPLSSLLKGVAYKHAITKIIPIKTKIVMSLWSKLSFMFEMIDTTDKPHTTQNSEYTSNRTNKIVSYSKYKNTEHQPHDKSGRAAHDSSILPQTTKYTTQLSNVGYRKTYCDLTNAAHLSLEASRCSTPGASYGRAAQLLRAFITSRLCSFVSTNARYMPVKTNKEASVNTPILYQFISKGYQVLIATTQRTAPAVRRTLYPGGLGASLTPI